MFMSDKSTRRVLVTMSELECSEYSLAASRDLRTLSNWLRLAALEKFSKDMPSADTRRLRAILEKSTETH